MNHYDTSSENYRRVLYTGDHPWIAGRLGVTYFDLIQECDLFKPDADADLESEWYRVHLENLIWL